MAIFGRSLGKCGGLGVVWALCLGATMIAAPGWAEDFALIVNPGNSFQGNDALATRAVKSLYLKERSQWPQGDSAKPFARPPGNPAQAAFLKAVLAMTDAELARHWIRQKQKTGATAPRELSSDTIALKMVQKYPGAFAVLKAETAESAGGDVRILFRFSN